MLASSLSYSCPCKSNILPTVVSWLPCTYVPAYDLTALFCQKLLSFHVKITVLDNDIQDRLAISVEQILQSIGKPMVIEYGEGYDLAFSQQKYTKQVRLNNDGVRQSQLQILQPKVENFNIESNTSSEKFMINCRDKCEDLNLHQCGDTLYELIPGTKLTYWYHCTVEEFISSRSGDLNSLLSAYRYSSSVLKFFTTLGRHALPQYYPNSE